MRQSRLRAPLAVAAIASSSTALALGLLLLNGGVSLVGVGQSVFEGLSVAGAVLAVLFLVRFRPTTVWTLAALVYVLSAATLLVMVRYQYGCATEGRCF